MAFTVVIRFFAVSSPTAGRAGVTGAGVLAADRGAEGARSCGPAGGRFKLLEEGVPAAAGTAAGAAPGAAAGVPDGTAAGR